MIKKQKHISFRALEIILTISSYFIFYKLNKHRHKILGQRIKEACEKLGTTFIKLGQMLSTRYDYLSERDCEVLQQLLDNVKPMPYKKVREIFFHDFKKYPEDIFVTFEKIASASISQVYRATLSHGGYLAVKVRRPYIGKIIRQDMKIIKRFFSFLELFSPMLRRNKSIKFIEEMENWLLEEIDFEHEAKNIDRLKKYHKKIKHKDIAHIQLLDIHKTYCSKNIITTTYISGIPLNRMSEIIDNPEYNIIQSLKRYTKVSMHAFLNEPFFLFQADPHPANIVIQKHGKVAILDYGLLAEINAENLQKMKKTMLAVYSGNLDETIRTTLAMCDLEYTKHHKKIRKDIALYLKKAKTAGIWYWFLGAVKIFIKHRLPVPYYLSAFGRSNFVLDGSIQRVDPSKKTIDLMGEELRSALIKEMIKDIKNIDYIPLIYTLSKNLAKSPQKLNKLVSKYSDDPLSMIKDIKRNIMEI